MGTLTYAESIVIASTPERVYDIVSDVTRTGEWSPVCKACSWENEEDGPRVGAWFTGRNETSRRTWKTRSQVVAAERGREFAFVVGEGYVKWAFTLAPVDEGTSLTETWEFLPKGLAMFEEHYGDTAEIEIADRTAAAHSGIPVTLAAIKRIAESR